MFSTHALRAFAALAMVFGASPALADTTTATQISVLHSNLPAATGDAEFSQLFASWRAIDGDNAAEIGRAAAPRIGVAIPSINPLEGAKLTSGYGMRTHPVLGGRRNHAGIDLASPTGTPVYAAADGVIAKAEPFSSYGNYIQIEHGGDMQTRYAHLSGYAVAAGQAVVKGQLIGYVGSTGRSTGPHLHYEVRLAGNAVDPRPYMVDTQLALGDSSLGQGGPE